MNLKDANVKHKPLDSKFNILIFYLFLFLDYQSAGKQKNTNLGSKPVNLGYKKSVSQMRTANGPEPSSIGHETKTDRKIIQQSKSALGQIGQLDKVISG